MSDVTEILAAIQQGDRRSADQLLPLVYDELRKLAAHRLAKESAGQTLQPTALVHEAYVRLVDANRVQSWESRGHFFAAAAEAMRRVLVDRAKRKRRTKHGGEFKRIELHQDFADSESGYDQILALNEALERFELEEPAKAELVKLRYFAGMSLEEAAVALGVSRATASRHWTYARSWLYSTIQEAGRNDT